MLMVLWLQSHLKEKKKKDNNFLIKSYNFLHLSDPIILTLLVVTITNNLEITDMYK